MHRQGDHLEFQMLPTIQVRLYKIKLQKNTCLLLKNNIISNHHDETTSSFAYILLTHPYKEHPVWLFNLQIKIGEAQNQFGIHLKPIYWHSHLFFSCNYTRIFRFLSSQTEVRHQKEKQECQKVNRGGTKNTDIAIFNLTG